MGQPSYLKNSHPVRKQTRRTETSKYPEEEKTIVIPLVVASERGIAQTYVVTAMIGVVGPQYLLLNELESVGNQNHRG